MCAPFNTKSYIRYYCIALAGSLISSVSCANTLKTIDFSQLPGGRFEVRIAFDTPPTAPKWHTIERPARIVIDFPNVVSGLKERRFPLTVDNGQSALVMTSEGRTRLILNLDNLATHTTRIEGNVCIIEVGAKKVLSGVSGRQGKR